MKKKIFAMISFVVIASLLLCGCSKKKIISTNTSETEQQVRTTSATKSTVKKTTAPVTPVSVSSPYDEYFGIGNNVVSFDESVIKSTLPVAVMKIENMDYVAMVLYPQNAPDTVNNFISVVSKGGYDGVSFFGFDSKLGLVASDGKEEYTIAFEQTGSPVIRHSDYVVFMNKDAGTGNTAGKSFFITLDESYQKDFDSDLNKEYVAIGEIIEGEEVLGSIAAKAAGETAQFKEIPTIEQIIIDLNGYEIKDVDKIVK